MRKIIFACLILFISGCSSNSEKEMDTIQRIDRELNTIVTSPEMSLSSNPYSYLKSRSDEFTYIVSKKEITLNHFLNKFSDSQDNGLKEYIMAAACVEILGEKNPVKEWSTGREWYEQYLKQKTALHLVGY